MNPKAKSPQPDPTPQQFANLARLVLLWCGVGEQSAVDGVTMQRIARHVGIQRSNPWLVRDGWLTRIDNDGYRSMYEPGPNMGRDPGYSGA